MADFNRYDILKSLKDTFRSVFDTIYYTDRPNSTTSQKDTFLVIRNGAMSDEHAYGDTYVSLMIFKKDIEGVENTKELDKIVKSAVSLLPINNSLFYTEHPQLLQNKSDGSGFHYTTVYFGITIK